MYRFYIALIFVLLASPAWADNYAVVDDSGNVDNVIVWDGVTPWSPPPNTQAIDISSAQNVGIGWSLSGSGTADANFDPPLSANFSAVPAPAATPAVAVPVAPALPQGSLNAAPDDGD
jgi:hypothetical protein